MNPHQINKPALSLGGSSIFHANWYAILGICTLKSAYKFLQDNTPSTSWNCLSSNKYPSKQTYLLWWCVHNCILVKSCFHITHSSLCHYCGHAIENPLQALRCCIWARTIMDPCPTTFGSSTFLPVTT